MNAQNTSTTNANLAAAAISQFGLSLFKKQAAQDKGKNVLVSPASAAIALAMTMNGARSSTLEGMKTTLGFGAEETIETINAAVEAMITALTDPESGVTLNVANAIWAAENIEFNDDFIARVTEAFKAKVTSTNLTADGTVGDINKWADENTNGKIKEIVKQISPDTRIMLLNAIYFKGKWSEEFNKARSLAGQFTGENGTETVTYMRKSDSLKYHKCAHCQAVSLPFGKSEQVALVVILPSLGTDINAFIEGIDGSVLQELRETWKSDVNLTLPRWEMEYDANLGDTLRDLGMGEALSTGANFTGMGSLAMHISSVRQKTYAKFDEEGGEAAAVTSVGIVAECVREVHNVVVDRSFVMALVDNKTGTLLFIGKVASTNK